MIAVGISMSSCKKEMNVDPISKTSLKESKEAEVQNMVIAYTIKASENTLDGNKVNIPAGSFVAIEAGTRGPLYLVNLKGAPGKPITFINASNGQVTIKGSGSWGLKVGYCNNIRITGSGSSAKYGIVVDGGHNAFVLPELTTDFEIDRVEVKNAGFAGIMAKTDPNCNSATWRSNYLMKNVSLHDNYIHDVKGEGFYIGNSFYNGRTESCGTVFPHEIHNLKIYNNIVKNTGCEGIQVGCARVNCEIYDNYIENYGTDPFANFQNNGLQIGAGTGGTCYNNIIVKGTGNGMIVNGTGGNVIFNNVIANAGALGIFCDERTPPVGGYSFINNTIVNTGSDGIRLYSEQMPFNNVINNIIINPKSGRYINAQSGVKLTNQNNYTHMDVNTVRFVNPSVNNYALLSSSPAVNTGANVSAHGVTFDINKAVRPSGGAYDIGAYEFTSIVTSAPTTSPAPAPTTSTSGQSVTSLTLINVATQREVGTITNGYVINYGALGTTNINIRANTNPATVGSVTFTLNGSIIRTENGAPYAIGGDNGTALWPWTLAPGNYTLVVTPFTSSNGQGTRGNAMTVNFTVVTSGTTSTTTQPAPTAPVTLRCVEDVYLNSGVRNTTNPLRVESGRRKIFLKFNVTQSMVNSARLRLRVDGDAGHGNIKVFGGSHSNWTRNTITSTNAPSEAVLAGQLNRTYTVGTTYEIDVSNLVKSAGTYTLIITQDAGGNDVGFASSSTAFVPQLILN